MDAATYDVFLSHNGQDKPAVERVAEKLRSAGVRPWLDKWQLTPGGRWQDELHAGLEACRAFAYFLGPNGEGDWAREELDAARSRAAKDRDFRIFPVLLPGTPDPFDRTTMPPFLGHRTWVDLRRGLDDPTGFQSFLNAIKGVPLGAPDAIVMPAGDADTSPYRGLDAFDEADATFFFGREPDIQGLLEQLKGGRFLAVLGPSGSGKSSLVRAGLVPALRHGALPASDRWVVEIVKPGARPSEAIAARLVGHGPGGGMQGTLDGLLTDERSLHLAATLALGDDPARRLVWVIDQAEELFTLSQDVAERTAVISNLTYAASVPGGRSMVILAMRADFYSRAAAYPDLAAHISRAQHLVAPLTPDGIRDAIEEPARVVGLDFEEGLVGTILDDLEGQPGSLPLLQYALLELWKRRRGGLLTLEGYRESGGVQGAIAKRAEAIYGGFTPEEQAIARRALLRLTQPGEGTEDTRRRASMRELVTRVDEAREVEQVIGELTDARLLTASADPATGEGLVDISHEALIRAWPRVREWLDEDRAGQRVLRRLTESSAEWTRLGRDEGLLFRGARLAEAVEWRTDHDELLNDDERAFLDASVAFTEREREAKERARRRVTIAAGALAAVFLVLAGLAGLQWLNAESARIVAQDASTAAIEARTEALGRAVAFQAEASAAYKDRALLLALEAARRSDAPDVRAQLLRHLTSEPRLVRFAGAIGPSVAWVDVQGTPPVVAWIDVAGVLRVADLASIDAPRLQVTVADGAAGSGVLLSRDGTLVAAAAGPQVSLWDVATGTRRWSVTIPDTGIVGRMAFVDGGASVAASGATQLLALGTDTGAVHLVDLADGAYLRQSVPPAATPDFTSSLVSSGFAFDADGRRLARAEPGGSISIWDVQTGAVLLEPFRRPAQVLPAGDPPFAVLDLAWGLGGVQVAILFNDGFGVLNLEPGPAIVGPLTAGVDDPIRIALAGPEGGFLVSSANRGLRYLGSRQVGQLAWETIGARPFPYAVAVTEQQQFVVAGYPDGRLAIYDLGDHWQIAQHLPLPTPPYGPVSTDQAYAIRADGEAFAWYFRPDERVTVRDRAGGLVAEVPIAADFVEAMALSADGTRLVTVDDRREPEGLVGWLVVRSLPDGAILREERLGPWGYRLALAADGRRAILGDVRGGLSVRDVTDGSVLWTAPPDAERGPIPAVAWDHDESTLLVGAVLGRPPFQRTAMLRYAVDDPAAPPTTLVVDTDRISAIAETPDGRLVVAAADAQAWTDGRLLLFDAAESRPSGALGPPGDNVAVLRIGPDGRLLSGGPVAGWFSWDIDPDSWKARACAIAARELTQQEWRDVLGDEPQRMTCEAPVPSADASIAP